MHRSKCGQLLLLLECQTLKPESRIIRVFTARQLRGRLPALNFAGRRGGWRARPVADPLTLTVYSHCRE